MAIIVDPDLLNQGTEITINTGARTFTLNIAGNLSNDGVTLQAIYSFFKEEWKLSATLIPHPFPMNSITPEQFEFIDNWEPANDATRKLIRTGGWREIDSNNVLQQEHAGVITLGSFEDTVNDRAYYQTGNDPTVTTAAVDFTYAGPVNEPVRIFNNITPVGSYAITTNNTITRGSGNWVSEGYVVGGEIVILNAEDAGNNGTFTITSLTTTVLVVSGTPLTNNAADTTMTAGYSYRNRLKLFLRVRDADPNGKAYAQADLTDIGVTRLQNQVYRFPLSNASDLKISTTDTIVSGSSPYDQIFMRYFNQNFSRVIDTAGTPRNFGIVVDTGTHSGVDGSVSSGGIGLTSSLGGISGSIYNGGTLRVHEGASSGSYSVLSTTPTIVTITGSTFPATLSNLSFTLQRSSPVVATAEQIYERVQYLLRQASDIDTTGQIVTGRTADELLTFVGDTLVAGRSVPNNPNGGGSGVVIEGFNSNDTNRLTFTDNSVVERTFPFVAAGTITFNTNLTNDTNPQFWMFFQYTKRTTVSDATLAGATGNAATLNSAGSNIPVLANNDYINITGFTNANNNGIWRVNDTTPATNSVDLIKVNGDTVANATATSITVDQHPFESDGAIIVKDNSVANIAGTITGTTRTFDFDYDGNVQGGRTASTDASIVIVAIGLETAQYVTAVGTITRATGLSFNVVAGLERNYNNP